MHVTIFNGVDRIEWLNKADWKASGHMVNMTPFTCNILYWAHDIQDLVGRCLSLWTCELIFWLVVSRRVEPRWHNDTGHGCCILLFITTLSALNDRSLWQISRYIAFAKIQHAWKHHVAQVFALNKLKCFKSYFEHGCFMHNDSKENEGMEVR